ncbi:substrate-binding domain-containing protein [Leifsonia poae]|uniref:substrate-binding domain-containing protein n=1 Tax=Leifsonia poae TaxID=110933 RepID=UPI003D678CCD
MPGVEADAVVLDDIGGAYRGTKAMLEAGHTRVAYLGNVTSVFTGQRRFEGYERALAEHGIPVDPELVRRGQQDVATASAAMHELLDLAHPPTAVFSANNRNTIGALEEIGARIRNRSAVPLPAIVSFDDFELADMMPVPVTVIDHEPRELGREAARLLFARLLDPTAIDPAHQIEMPTQLRIARA